jgi:hypothetical protein
MCARVCLRIVCACVCVCMCVWYFSIACPFDAIYVLWRLIFIRGEAAMRTRVCLRTVCVCVCVGLCVYVGG